MVIGTHPYDFIARDYAKPTGVVLEASAANLPLESVAALVPGLKLSGTLDRADLVIDQVLP